MVGGLDALPDIPQEPIRCAPNGKSLPSRQMGFKFRTGRHDFGCSAQLPSAKSFFIDGNNGNVWIALKVTSRTSVVQIHQVNVTALFYLYNSFRRGVGAASFIHRRYQGEG